MNQFFRTLNSYINPSQVLLPSAPILEILGPWRVPDDADAREATKHLWDHHDLYDVLRTPTRDLKDFGNGHTLYFYFIKWMCILFVVLSGLSGLPQVITNLTGMYYIRGDIELTTIGNFGMLWSSKTHAQGMVTLEAQKQNCTSMCAAKQEDFISMYFRSKTSSAKLSSGWSKAEALKFSASVDMAGCLIYLGTTFYIIWSCEKVAREADRSTVTIEDYSMFVEGLPEDALEADVAEFFSQFGKVAKAELARSYGQLINAAVKRQELIEQLETAVARVQKAAGCNKTVPEDQLFEIKEAHERLREATLKLAKLQQEKQNTRVVCAMITFEDEKSKAQCFSAMSTSYLRDILQPKQSPKFKDKYTLHITPAPQPTDIFYENLEHSYLDRHMRRVGTSAAKYVCLGIGFILVNLATSMRGAVGGKQSEDTMLCTKFCRYTHPSTGELQLKNPLRTTYKKCFRSNAAKCADINHCYKCYCTQAVVQGMLAEVLYCSSFASNMFLIFLAQVLQVLGITIINLSLQYISGHLTDLEMHHTRSKAARSLCHKLFLLQFLNTAMTTTIANASLPMMKSLVKGTLVEGIFFEGVYSDITPGWYKEVGRALIMSMLVGMTLRVGFVVLRYVQFQLQFKQRLDACLTQSQLVKAWTGPEFELASRYADLCNQIFVTMVFAAGMPIMYLFTAGSFLLTYWAEKYELLKLSRRPNLYGTALQEMVGNLLPYAAVWHCLSSIWIYSFFGDSPRSTFFGSSSVRNLAGVIRSVVPDVIWKGEAEKVAARVLSAYTGHYIVGLIAVTAVLLSRNTVAFWVEWGKYLLRALRVLKTDDEEELEGVPEFALAVQSHILMGPTSYAVQQNPNYISAFKPMAPNEERAARSRNKTDGEADDDEDLDQMWKKIKHKRGDGQDGRDWDEDSTDEESEENNEGMEQAAVKKGSTIRTRGRKRKGKPHWMLEMFDLYGHKAKQNQVLPAPQGPALVRASSSFGLRPGSEVSANAALELSQNSVINGSSQTVDAADRRGKAARQESIEKITHAPPVAPAPKGFLAKMKATWFKL